MARSIPWKGTRWYTAAVPILRLRDDLGRELTFASPPARIVSLVPSDTHSLCALGLTPRLVARTRYCDVPEAAHVPAICGTKDVDVEAIVALSPDVVIANQEENSRAPLEALAQRGVKVFVSLPRRVEDALAHLARLARLCGVAEDPSVVELLRRGYRALTPPAEGAALRVTAFVPIWLDPLMTFNGDTFGSDVLARCGVANAFVDRLRLYPLAADLGKSAPVDAGARDVRYPRVSFDEVRKRAPALVLLPDEPHEFSADDLALIERELPEAKVVRCSGRDLFWYGAWTIDAVPRLRAALAAVIGD
ncbi:MAG: ABC transporter substrate-binding protein [Myxococcales bacterium]|nr:ABC transporter substrate-binding protein [Myxococcales bacterium]